MPVTNLVAYLLIRSRWLISATKFNKHAAYHIRGAAALRPRIKIANFERSWMERLFMKINRLALFTASMHLAEERSLTNLDTEMGMADPSGKKDNLWGTSHPIVR